MREIMVQNGDIRLRVEVTGEGPLVMFVHGWPESPHSWRHQIRHLADRGYRCAAIDVRGYGGSSAPQEIERYTLRELSSDVAAVASDLAGHPTVLVGHDWGTPIVYQAALRYPELVRGVVGVSVPYRPPSDRSTLDVLRSRWGDTWFYMLHFQQPGVIEAEFGADLRRALKTVYHSVSGDGDPHSLAADAPPGTPMLPLLPQPPDGPLGFMSDSDLDVYVRSFERSGLHGGFHRYRCFDLDAEQAGDLAGAQLDHPACFVGGELDNVRYVVPGIDGYADLAKSYTDLRASTIVEGRGHWLQQEAPDIVNVTIDEFLATLDP